MANFKNIQFKYVKITGGSSTIDVTMDDAKFKANKPVGYYRCFVFNKGRDDMPFNGYDYDVLQELVNLEMTDVWSPTYRDTLIGFDEGTKTFVCNIGAYLGLKDPDLKTDGDIPHSGQVGWFVLSLETDKTESIITLKQTDGTDVYLKIKEVNKFSFPTNIFGNDCIEYDKKKVAGSTVVEKLRALWCKSPEDNSVLMVNNCTPISKGQLKYQYLNSGRIQRVNNSIVHIDYQSFAFGKPVIYFIDSSATQSPVSLTSFYNGVYIKNNTGADHVEYTETSNLDDILKSGEYVIFQTSFKTGSTKYYRYGGIAYTINSSFISSVRSYNNEPYATARKGDATSKYFTEIERKDNPRVGLKCNLISYDPKDKPFVYSTDDVIIEGHKSNFFMSRTGNFIKNLPDGYIACVLMKDPLSTSKYHIMRIKNGDPVKIKSIAKEPHKFHIEISGATGFGKSLYRNKGSSYGIVDPVTVSKDELVNATGFIDAALDAEYKSVTENFCLPIVTILKI